MTSGPDSAAPAPPPSKRVEAKMQTRFRIRSAAVELFREQGFNNVTTEHIAARVGVTQRTLFRHFKTKDAILFDDDSIVEFFEETMGRQLALHPPIEATRLTFLEMSEGYDRNATLFRADHRVIVESNMLQAFSRQRVGRIDDLLAFALDGQEAFQRRSGQPSLRSRVAAAAVMGAIRPVMDAWLAGEIDGSMVAISRSAWPTWETILTRGLSVDLSA